MQDLSSTTEVKKIVDTTVHADGTMKTLFGALNKETQTDGLDLRELQGLDKAVQRTRGELTNNLAKLTELDTSITQQSGVIATGPQYDETQKG